MKKSLLFTLSAAALLFVSCSKDDSSPKNSVVTAKIDGVEKTFNTIHVETQDYTENDASWTDVTLTASIDNDPSLRISFITERYAVGLDASWYFAYFLDDTAFPKEPGFQVSVTENTSHTLKGTFAGQVRSDDGTNVVTNIEAGTFNIYY
jgi:hypothetical protein